MGWLVNITVASIVAAFLLVRIFDYVFAGVVGNVAHALRASIFVSTWTAVTTGSGMNAFTKRVRQLRHGTKDLSRRIKKG